MSLSSVRCVNLRQRQPERIGIGPEVAGPDRRALQQRYGFRVFHRGVELGEALLESVEQGYVIRECPLPLVDLVDHLLAFGDRRVLKRLSLQRTGRDCVLSWSVLASSV